MKTYKQFVEEMVGVGSIAGSGSPSLPADQREPGVSRKVRPVMFNIRRKKPKY